MKKILVSYYAHNNLGDDLFIWALAKKFSDCRIKLICRHKYFSSDFPDNVKVSYFSYVEYFYYLLRRIIGSGKFEHFICKLVYSLRSKIAKKYDAFVEIGGSIYMDRSGEPIDFFNNISPKYDWNSIISEKGNTFVIGANLGPAASKDYWNNIRRIFNEKTHVCLRDYSSYLMVADLPNVQYAPDVLFNIPTPPLTGSRSAYVVISVIDISRHTNDQSVVDWYFQLVIESVKRFNKINIPVLLMSFCQDEGDEKIIQSITGKLCAVNDVSEFYYRKNIKTAVELLAGASFIIGTRFHSIILGFDFGIPVYPIVYNCKTRHYLKDIKFQGKYADIENAMACNVDDVMESYRNKEIIDCALHKYYAAYQFKALNEYLESIADK